MAPSHRQKPGTSLPIGPASDLAALATGRSDNLFASDLAATEGRLAEGIRGRRILVVGGAGSIGSATVEMIADREPGALHVVDPNENGLAELTRHLHSRPGGISRTDLRFWPLDFGSPLMRSFIEEMPRYDAVLNFAALKHVRSEKDTFSLLQMVDTNVVKMARFLGWLSTKGFDGRYYCVSTDKAANPVSLMGATKRLMEHVTLSREIVPSFSGIATSARFANVAFSDGSLLHGFVNRLARREPLAAPRSIRRFFISPAEAASICLISALSAPNTVTLVPRNETLALTPIEDIVAAFLRHFGLEPDIHENAETARRCVAKSSETGRYPVLLTTPDTSGEKPFEEFVSDEEKTVEIGLKALVGISYHSAPAETLRPCIDSLSELVDEGRPLSKQQIVDILGEPIPLLRHIETNRNLDQRM